MNLQQVLTVIALIFGGGGIVGWYMTFRQARITIEKDRREKILSEEHADVRGAGLIVTTSAEAIAVFQVALQTATQERDRIKAERDALIARVELLEARVRELERKTP